MGITMLEGEGQEAKALQNLLNEMAGGMFIGGGSRVREK